MPFHKKSIVYSRSTIVNKPAFTLIELLIVIALISLLSGIGFYGYQSSQKRARDSQRKNDLATVKKALEEAKNDCLSGSYYNYAPSYEDQAFSGLIDSLMAANFGYLKEKIQDPLPNTYYRYNRAKLVTTACPNPTTLLMTRAGTRTYVLRAKLEITNDPELDKSRTKCQIHIDQINTSFAPSSGWNNTINGLAPAANDGYYYVCPD